MAPVVSPSLKSLHALRRRQPLRPLIFCQTAFERPPPVARLRRLIRRRAGPAEILARDDPYRTLFWLQRWPGRPPQVAWTEARQMPHPRAQLLADCRVRYPRTHLTLTEDGRFVEQLSFAQPMFRLRATGAVAIRMRKWDNRWLRTFAAVGGVSHVFAQKPETLRWFRRDCLRLLNGRVLCREFPHMPDPRDPCPYFILVPDRSLRFRALPPDGPRYHLDGGLRRRRYREARASAAGTAAWRCESRVGGRAEFPLGSRRLLLITEGKGWYTWCGEEGPRDDLSAAFLRRWRTYLRLQSDGKSRAF